MPAPTAQTLPPDVGSLEIVEHADITYRQLDHWTNLGRLRVRQGARSGSGVPRRYPASEIAVARLLRVLPGFGQHPGLDDLCAWVRAGFRGSIELEPGIILDLDAICGPP